MNEEQLLNQDLQEKYQKLIEKKDSMKNEIHSLQQQLEKSKSDYKFVSSRLISHSLLCFTSPLQCIDQEMERKIGFNQ